MIISDSGTYGISGSHHGGGAMSASRQSDQNQAANVSHGITKGFRQRNTNTGARIATRYRKTSGLTTTNGLDLSLIDAIVSI
jgi:hypothetical protein